jgi:hypothetical protein
MSKPLEPRVGTPFEPSNPFNQYLNDSVKAIPRYLFRVSDPSSYGITSRAEVCSPAAQATIIEAADLYKMPTEEAAQVLGCHLWWNCTPSGPGACNLMSWTSSLLIALQYGVYRHRSPQNPHGMSEIKILVVDTRQFDRNAFARDLQILAAFNEVSGEHKLGKLYEWRNGDLLSGEYLSQGKLVLDPKRSYQVSLEDLVTRGLFSVSIGLGDQEHWSRWIRRVEELRREMCYQSTQLSAVVIETAVRVAMAFEPFKLPAAIMLLSLSPYNFSKSVSAIFEELIKNGFGKIQSKLILLTCLYIGTNNQRN